MKSKKYLLMILITICLCIFFGCNNNDFDKLVIIADSVSDIAEGEYTLVYSIKDYQKLANDYDITIKVKAFDQDNLEVEVKNNRTIIVKKDFVYTVVVYCSTQIKEETVTKSKQFLVTAQKNPPSVNFFYKYENTTSHRKTIVLEYDQSLPLSEVPELINWYANYVEGVQREITSRKWVVYIDSAEYELNQTHLNNIKSTLNVYGVYTYKQVNTAINYIFVANGGEETPSISGMRNSSINRPTTNPTRDGYTFDCWYTDIDLTTPYNWKDNKIFLKSHTLYAKWIPQVGNFTDFGAFTFNPLVDENDNTYYEISAKQPSSITNMLTLPSGYNNIPIKKIATSGFASCNMTAVTIPNYITSFGQYSFKDCPNLTSFDFGANNGMEALAWHTFSGCNNLQTITNFPNNITQLGSEAFKNCASLASFTIPNKVLIIQTEVFAGCTSLESMDIPDSVVDILSGAFNGCTALTALNFTINSNLVGIAGTFEGSTENSALYNTNITSIKLPFYFKDKTNPFEGTEITVSYFDAPPKTE